MNSSDKAALIISGFVAFVILVITFVAALNMRRNDRLRHESFAACMQAGNDAKTCGEAVPR